MRGLSLLGIYGLGLGIMVMPRREGAMPFAKDFLPIFSTILSTCGTDDYPTVVRRAGLVLP